MFILNNLKTLFQSCVIQSFGMTWNPYFVPINWDGTPKQDQKIWYLGGGQLAQLAAVAAQRQGFETVVFAEDGPNWPAVQVSPSVKITYKETKEAVNAIMESGVSVVTAEWENVPWELAKAIHEAGISMYPNWNVYKIVQDRQTEKEAIIDCFDWDRDSVVNFAGSVKNEKDLRTAFTDIKSGILKTAGGGYDGKGQQRINTQGELDEYITWVRWEQESFKLFEQGLWDTTNKEDKRKEISDFKKKRKFVDFDETKCIFEELVEEGFYEISVMVAQSTDGSIIAFDPSHNKHEDGILVESIMPAWESPELKWKITPDVVRRVKEMAIQLTKKYGWDKGIIGLVWVEMFILPDETIKINEIAPRPHNSGHTTSDSHDISQFEALNTALTGGKLTEPKLKNKVHLMNMNKDEVLDIEWIEEKTWIGWRREDRWFAVYETQDKDGNIVITTDYGKWINKTDEQEVTYDEKGNIVVRKKWHINTISELDEYEFQRFKEAV
jgi:5-(carboxyamino)imidazole ribonucleotide synthase